MPLLQYHTAGHILVDFYWWEWVQPHPLPLLTPLLYYWFQIDYCNSLLMESVNKTWTDYNEFSQKVLVSFAMPVVK